MPVAYGEARLRTEAGAKIAAAIVELSKPLTSDLGRLQGITELLPHTPMLASPAFPLLPASTQFDLALVAFAERCGMARNRVVKLLRMVW